MAFFLEIQWHPQSNVDLFIWSNLDSGTSTYVPYCLFHVMCHSHPLFELLYGYYFHVFDLYNSIEETMALARENLEAAQNQCKRQNKGLIQSR